MQATKPSPYIMASKDNGIAEADTSPMCRWTLTNKILTSKTGNSKENNLKDYGANSRQINS